MLICNNLLFLVFRSLNVHPSNPKKHYCLLYVITQRYGLVSCSPFFECIFNAESLSLFWLSMQTPLERLKKIIFEDIEKVLLFILLILYLCISLFGSIISLLIIQHFLRSYFLQIWDAVPEPETTTLYEFFKVWKITSISMLMPLAYMHHVLPFCLSFMNLICF